MNFQRVEVDGVRVYGDRTWRGACPAEGQEQATFFNKIRREFPDTYGALAVHIRNEQQLRGGQFSAVAKQKIEGMTPGASDIIIPARVTFVCELKRKDHTKSKWQPDQEKYLIAAHDNGAFACVALGYEAAFEALYDWQKMQNNSR